MMNTVNMDLLNRIRTGLMTKRAFVPMGPDGAQTAPPQDPNMSAPPMGGMPQGGGGMPMDPSMMGGQPQGGGGMPPGGDPSTAGVQGSGQPVMLQMNDLMQLLQMAGGGGGNGGGGAGAGAGGDGKGKGGGAKALEAKIDAIATDLSQIKAFIMGATGQDLNGGAPGGAGGAMPQMGGGVGTDQAPPQPMVPGMPQGMPPGMDQGGGGMPMDPSMMGGGGMPPGGMQVQGSLKEKKASLPPMQKAKMLSNIINRLSR